ncbi:MAG TPA: oxidoreductase, partial [Pirellulales bacterium]|nr:oxidoreductase [Pirellulales bacterium]
ASLTQVGIIVAEIGLGFRYVALIHIIGHGCLRTLQFVRAPSLLLDYRSLENAIGTRLPRSSGSFLQVRFYRLALERGYLDAWLSDYVVQPFLRVFKWCDGLERSWTNFLSGGQSRASERFDPTPEMLEELL